MTLQKSATENITKALFFIFSLSAILEPIQTPGFLHFEVMLETVELLLTARFLGLCFGDLLSDIASDLLQEC